MTDLPRILENYSNTKGYFFNYGNKATQNLIDWRSEIIINDNQLIYFLLDRTKYNNKINNFGNIEGATYEGWFWLVVKSDFDLIYFNQINNESKYTKNIEPLKFLLNNLQTDFACSEMIINKLEVHEVADLLDNNCDGLAVNYSIYVPNDFSL